MTDNYSLETVIDPTTEEEMIQLLTSYREHKRNLDAMEERGKKYIEQVKAEVEGDLEPFRVKMSALKHSLYHYIEDRNEGKSFKVPGLGTAYTRDTRKVTIEEDKFKAWMWSHRPDMADDVVEYVEKVNKQAVKEFAIDALESDGELIPGTTVEDVTSVSVRLTGGE